jgi:hypothetical protein
MSKPATPLDNQAAIAQINNSINFLITEFLRPTALQTQANAEAIASLTADLRITRQVVDDLAAESLVDGRRSANNSANIENLLAESREDRRQSDERFDESTRRFDAQIAEIRAQGEQIRALLSALATTNGRVDDLEQAG